MSKQRKLLPLCHSEFLQDVTIALGLRSFKGLKYACDTLTFDVSYKDCQGRSYEQLNVESWTASDRLLTISVREDGIGWLYSAIRRKNAHPQDVFEATADLSDFSPEEIASLWRATL